MINTLSSVGTGSLGYAGNVILDYLSYYNYGKSGVVYGIKNYTVYGPFGEISNLLDYFIS